MLKATDKKKFAKLVAQNKKFVISGHQGPDGDVIGSTLAMASGLKSLGKTVLPFNNDGCPEVLRFLPGSNTIKNDISKSFSDAVLITVDSGDLERLGNKIKMYKFKEIWNVDHHKSNTKFGDHNFIDISAGSTGQVVFDLLSSCRGFKVNKTVAQSVYCTLSTDTGSFKYSNATPEVFNLAAQMVSAGAEPAKISQALYETYPARRLALLQKALGNLSFELGGKLALMLVTLQDFAATGALSEDTDEFVNFPRGVSGVKVVCFIKQKTDTEWKISFRSRDGFKVLSLAKQFGGGGHELAAGATFHGDIQSLKDKVLKSVNALVGEI